MKFKLPAKQSQSEQSPVAQVSASTPIAGAALTAEQLHAIEAGLNKDRPAYFDRKSGMTFLRILEHWKSTGYKKLLVRPSIRGLTLSSWRVFVSGAKKYVVEIMDPTWRDICSRIVMKTVNNETIAMTLAAPKDADPTLSDNILDCLTVVDDEKQTLKERLAKWFAEPRELGDVFEETDLSLSNEDLEHYQKIADEMDQLGLYLSVIRQNRVKFIRHNINPTSPSGGSENVPSVIP